MRQRKALHARPDRDRNHVFFQPIVITNARIAPGRKNIDEAASVNDHRVESRERRRETENDRRQISRAALIGTFSRNVPAGRLRKQFTTSSAASTSRNAGPSRSSKRCPASVGTTVRVVR